MTTKAAEESARPEQEPGVSRPVQTFPDGAYYTPEQDRQNGSTRRHAGSSRGVAVPRSAFTAVAAVLVIGVSFFAGVQYQKGHTTARLNGTQAGAFSANGYSGMGSRMGTRAGGFGTVTAVSGSSITISLREFGPNSSSSSATSKTYAITDATTVTVEGATGSVSDIQTGDTVFVRTASSTSTVATEIRVGDTEGPGGDMQQAPGASGTTTDTTNNASTI